MPVAPVETAPSVAPVATPPEDYQNISAATPAAFGALPAQAEQRAGQQVEQAGLKIQDIWNQVASDNGVNQFQDAIEKKLWGDHDTGEPGIMTLKGADALAAAPKVRTDVEHLREQIKGGLQNTFQQAQFEQATRRLWEFRSTALDAHLEQQGMAYALTVNQDTQHKSAITAANDGSDAGIANALQDSRKAAIQSAQLVHGATAAPEITDRATSDSNNYVLKAVIERKLADNDPIRAAQILDKFGPLLDPNVALELRSRVRGAADTQTVDAAVQQDLMQPGAIVPPGARATPDQIGGAIHQQESGGAAVAPTSVAGAQGGWQIEPATFTQYAKPGEDIAKPADNEAVGKRIVADYAARYNNDAGRVAVAYFSGPGNVAPPGSPTPWIRDAADATGKTTSGYVTDVLNRINGAPGSASAGGRQALADAYGNEGAQLAAAEARAQQRFPTDPRMQMLYVSKFREQMSQVMTIRAQQQAAQDRATQQAQQKAGNDVVTSLLTDPLHFDVATIAANPSLTAEQKLHLTDAARAEITRAAGGGPDPFGADFGRLYTAVTAPEGTTGRITDPTVLWQDMKGGGLTPAGYEKLNAALAGRRTVQGDSEAAAKRGFFDDAHLEISQHGFGQTGRDPIGEHKYSQFLVQALTDYDRGRAAGLTPQQLLSEKSPDYIGKIIPQYQRSAAEKFRDFMAANKPPDLDEATKVLGETPAKPPPSPVEIKKSGIIAAYNAGQMTFDQAHAALIELGVTARVAAPATTPLTVQPAAVPAPVPVGP